MKIVHYEEFIQMPPGTLFTEFEPNIFGNLRIKGDSINEDSDFYFQSIHDAVECDRIPEDGIAKALDGGVEMDFDIQQRDGLFEHDRHFAVWSRDDVLALYNRIWTCL